MRSSLGPSGRRRLAALLLATAGLAALPGLARLHVDNRLERWASQDGDDAIRYRDFTASFGSDEFVLVAAWGRPLFDADALDALLDAAEALENVPGITRVQGLPLVWRDLFGAEDPEAFAAEVAATPLYRNLLVSKDLRTAGLLAQVTANADPSARKSIMAGVRAAVARLDRAHFTTATVGSTVLITELDRLSAAEARRTVPIALIASLAVLLPLVRSWRAAAVAVASAALAVVITLGALGWSGRDLTMLSAALPALLWVLALSNIVHILARYQRHRTTVPAGESLQRALAEAAAPCTLSAFTTALGFGSLVVASLGPVRELGLAAAAGILIALAVNLTVGPELILRLDPPGARLRGMKRVADPPLALAARQPWPVVVVTILFVGAAVAVLPRISLAANPLRFLPKDDRLVRAYGEVGRRLTGFHTVETVVDLPSSWTDPEVWPVLDRLDATLSASPCVARVVSPLDLLREANRWEASSGGDGWSLPESQAAAARLIASLPAEVSSSLATMVAAGGRRVRLSAVVDDMDEAATLRLAARAKAALSALPMGYDGEVTGLVLRLVEGQRDLVRTQLASLGVAVLVVFSTVALGLGSVRLMLVSVVPNLAPVLAALAVMAVAGLHLDAATVMTASVALGIAVDNTLHQLVAYRRLAGTLPPREAASAAVREVGWAMAVTTSTAIAGFLALTAADFLPIRDFGLLASVAMAVALAADLMLVPALLALGLGGNGTQATRRA
jgi:uncharacterized protein